MTTYIITYSTTTSTFVNTYATASQIIPTVSVGDNDTGGMANDKKFSVMAGVILGVAGGLLLCIVSYKIYRWIWRYKHRTNTVLLFNDSKDPGLLPPSMSSNLLLGSVSSLPQKFGFGQSSSSFNMLDEKDPESPWSPDSVAATAKLDHSQMSTNELRKNASRQSLASYGGIRSMPSKNSLAASYPSGTSLYGAAGGGQAPKRTTRLSGAPHSPFSRIKIVPPPPLGIPGNSVVASDKTTLEFSPNSGIAADDSEREVLFDPVEAMARSSAAETDHLPAPMTPEAFATAKSAYLAEGPLAVTHRSSGSFITADSNTIHSTLDAPFLDVERGSSSDETRASSFVDRQRSRDLEDDMYSDRTRPLSALSDAQHGQVIEQPSSPLDRLQHELQIEAAHRRSFVSPSSQLDDLLSR